MKSKTNQRDSLKGRGGGCNVTSQEDRRPAERGERKRCRGDREKGREIFYKQKLKRSLLLSGSERIKQAAALSRRPRPRGEAAMWTGFYQLWPHIRHLLQAIQTLLWASTHKVALYSNPQHIGAHTDPHLKEPAASGGVCVCVCWLARMLTLTLISNGSQEHSWRRKHWEVTHTGHGMEYIWDETDLQVTELSAGHTARTSLFSCHIPAVV